MTGKLKIGKYEIKKAWLYAAFIVISAIQLGVIVYTFQTKKESYNADELWSYGFANSYYMPYLYEDLDGNEINQCEWVDSEVINDYLVVNEGEEFSYGSVFYNHSYDLSPPLHSLILHTICSFFPGEFSPWFSFVINIAAFAITISFLFLCVRLLKDEIMAILVCAWYGFSSIAIDTFIYLRPYALGTALFMVLLYMSIYMMDSIKQKKQMKKWFFPVMGAIAFLGFMTHYYVILAAGILTALICIWLLIRKRVKITLGYGGTMLVALLLMMLCCRNIFSIFNSQSTLITSLSDTTEAIGFSTKFKMLLSSLTEELVYIEVSYYKSALPQIILACLIFLIIICIPLVYLMRDTKVVTAARRKMKSFAHKPLLYLKHWNRSIEWTYLILFIMVAIYLIVVTSTAAVVTMGSTVSRYLLFIAPAAVIMLMGIISGLLDFIFRKKRIISKGITVIALLAMVVLDIGYYGSFKSFFFRKKTVGEDMTEVLSGTNCIYVDSHDWLIEAACIRLKNVDSYFQVDPTAYDLYADEYETALIQDEAVMLVVDDIYTDKAEYLAGFAVDDETAQEIYDMYMQEYYDIINYFNDLYPDYDIEKVSEEVVHGYKLDVYIIKPED